MPTAKVSDWPDLLACRDIAECACEHRKGRDREASTVWTANGIAQAPKNAIELTAAMTRARLGT